MQRNKCYFESCTKDCLPNQIKCIKHKLKPHCKLSGCRKQAARMGLCKAHGGKKSCCFVDCTKPSRHFDHCYHHRNLNPWATRLKDNGTPVCSVEKCRNKVQSNSLCKKHLKMIQEQTEERKSFAEPQIKYNVDVIPFDPSYDAIFQLSDGPHDRELFQLLTEMSVNDGTKSKCINRYEAPSDSVENVTRTSEQLSETTIKNITCLIDDIYQISRCQVPSSDESSSLGIENSVILSIAIL